MKEQEKELLVQGIKEYPDALNAIRALQDLLQKRIRTMIEENVEDYAGALQIETPELKEHIWDDGDGTSFQIGIKFRYKHRPIRWATFYHSIEWRREESGELETIISFEVWSAKKNIDRLREVISQDNVHIEGKVVWLEDTIVMEDALSIDGKLESLLQKWIDLWREVGGIKALADNESDGEDSSE